MESFSVKKFYTKLRGSFEQVTWRKLMQSNLGAPKWKFIVYLAVQRKLMTKDRLRGLGYVEEVTCDLCNKEEESIDHLFFSCSYTSQVWTMLLQWQGIYRKALQWNEELNWTIKYCKGRSIKAELYRLILAGAVYHVWQERNNIIFRGVKQSIQELVRDIVQAIHGRGRCVQRLHTRLDEMNYYPT
ncbi:PREDICTED: uncharacterized protein LOC109227893 [Nicotiana attenuata]|uniref:uncharacterized protein LOC109227893 n=1 Tax=Nicotiana attenuata TaxID=49451 RepID=UPI000904ED39|nr:PREDICTED: uncharacterized protein LOC109227893 [Nicotiana attenuata]